MYPVVSNDTSTIRKDKVVKLSPADQKKYPKLTEYVRYQIPKLSGIPRIVENIQTYGSLTWAELRTALTWGHPPLIVLNDLTAARCGGHLNAYGCFRPHNPAQIEVAKRFALLFETNAAEGKDNKNIAGKRVYVVGATLLHELCHWGNRQHGVAEATEQGLAFERATYGKTIW